MWARAAWAAILIGVGALLVQDEGTFLGVFRPHNFEDSARVSPRAGECVRIIDAKNERPPLNIPLLIRTRVIDEACGIFLNGLRGEQGFSDSLPWRESERVSFLAIELLCFQQGHWGAKPKDDFPIYANVERRGQPSVFDCYQQREHVARITSRDWSDNSDLGSYPWPLIGNQRFTQSFVRVPQEIGTHSGSKAKQSSEEAYDKGPARNGSFILTSIFWFCGALFGGAGVALVVIGFDGNRNWRTVRIGIGLAMMVLAFVCGWIGASFVRSGSHSARAIGSLNILQFDGLGPDCNQRS
jgi:hypothetical protein